MATPALVRCLLTVLYASTAAAACNTFNASDVASVSCKRVDLSGHVRMAADGTLVGPNGEMFNFTSINVPNLHRIEVDDVTEREPSVWEIADALCSVQQMGGKVARIYVLSHGDDPMRFHVTTGGHLSERWFRVLDQVLVLARALGIRLIIPFVNTAWIERWGSTAFYAQWAGQPRSSSSEFFHDASQRALFKAVVTAVLSRVNSLSGTPYADEPAVLAWELGNELHDPRYGLDLT
jgi:mannan endo-1,4-beta-mannosidase